MSEFLTVRATLICARCDEFKVGGVFDQERVETICQDCLTPEERARV